MIATALTFAGGVFAGFAQSVSVAASADHSSYTNMFSDSYLPDCQSGGPLGGGNDFICRQENTATYFYSQTSLSQSARTEIREYLENRDPTVDLNFVYDATPVYGTSDSDPIAETDIVFIQQNLPGAVRGQAWCNNAWDSLECDQHYVAFDSANPGKYVICHESGHSFGLKHGSAGHPSGTLDNAMFLQCMRTPIPPDSGTQAYLGSHNVGEINSTY